MMRPWNNLLIRDCGECLESIPSEFLRFEPHPYASLGAPYGKGVDPYCLRSGVIRRLFIAQGKLDLDQSGMRLMVFDAWRPVVVQAFMVEHALAEECRSKGVDPLNVDDRVFYDGILEEVRGFWAPPSNDFTKPPPHSTGGALDITLAEMDGTPLDMGGKIDEISAVSEPNYYFEIAKLEPNSKGNLWHRRRETLYAAMRKGGFVQHPKEWWHFSYGDQLWAWKSNSNEAIYGAFNPSDNKSMTF